MEGLADHMGKRVLVTGGCGYIGSILVPMLLAHGHTVRVLDKLYFGEEPLSAVKDRIELVPGDVRAMDGAVLDDMEAVIHLGSLSNDPTSEFHPEATDSINHRGTTALAEACKARGIGTFTFASSCAVYGFHVEGVVDEDFPAEPQSSYARSKLAAERDLQTMADDTFCPVILRQATVCGLSPRMRWDIVLNAFVMHAFKSGRLDVWYGGEAWRPIVDVKDVAAAHICCIEAEPRVVRGQVFNVVHDNFRILDLARRVAETLGGLGIDVGIDVNRDEVDRRSYRTSGERISQVLDFQARVSPEEAVREIASALQDGRYRDFDHPAYYNMPWMKLLLDVESRLKTTGPVL